MCMASFIQAPITSFLQFVHHGMLMHPSVPTTVSCQAQGSLLTHSHAHCEHTLRKKENKEKGLVEFRTRLFTSAASALNL